MRTVFLRPSNLAVALAGLLAAGCAAENGAVPPGGTDATGAGVGGGSGSGGSDEPCTTDGDERSCSIHNAYGCLEGTQTCESGAWSDCNFGVATEDRILRPSGKGPRLPAPNDMGAASKADEDGAGRVGQPGGVANRAVGASCNQDSDCGSILEYCDATDTCALLEVCLSSTTCPPGEYCSGLLGAGFCAAVAACGEDGTQANPCDPECHALEPVPADFAAPGVPWGSGSFNNYPASTLNAGLPNNCDEGANANDCQFDHYCESNGNGECVPWGVNGVDLDCVGQVNVTIGLPCDDGIPVCNRGTVPVTNDFFIDHSSSYTPATINSGNPDLTGGGADCAYVVADFGTIDPGECVMVPFDCGTPSTADDILPGELIGARNPTNECNNGDNFGYYAAGAAAVACGAPTCGGGVSVSNGPVDLSMFAWIDRSLTMVASRQNTVCRGLRDFAATPANATIQFEYKQWPDRNRTGGTPPCGGSGACQSLDWLNRQACYGAAGNGSFVPLGPLSSFAMPCNDFAPPAGNATYTTGTNGGTPILEALRGARHRARLEKMANPDRAVVIVFVTDAVEIGGSENCNMPGTGDPAPYPIRQEVQDALALDGVYTAVVGIDTACPSPRCTQANDIASWGGTGAAIHMSGSGTPAALTNAMNAIRNSFSCSREVPDPLPSGVTISDIDVNFNNGGVSTPLTLVGGVGGDASDCTGGAYEFYYDGAGTITMCPTTCGTVTGTIGSNVEFIVPCGPSVVPVSPPPDSFTVPAGTCPQGSIPKWTQMLTNGLFPGGSSIRVEGFTKIDPSDPDPSPIPWELITDLPATNPIDLFGPLSGATPPMGYGEVLQLRFNSTPGSSDHDGNPLTPNIPVAPTLGDYEVQFTCEFTE